MSLTVQHKGTPCSLQQCILDCNARVDQHRGQLCGMECSAICVMHAKLKHGGRHEAHPHGTIEGNTIKGGSIKAFRELSERELSVLQFFGGVSLSIE
jgi:hypothetical protein